MKLGQKQLEQYFPQKPYPLQSAIAKDIYSALQGNQTKLYILQSPTGTGKTYSLLCPILFWLKKHKSSIIKYQEPQKVGKFPTWLKKTSEHKGQRLLLQRQKALSEMQAIQQISKQAKLKSFQIKQREKIEQMKSNKYLQQIEIQSQQELDQPYNAKKAIRNQQKLVMKQLKVEEENVLPKVIFVSRTHSQLSQVVESIKIILSNESISNLNFMQIASKQHLCINKAINQQKSSINEKCQHLLDHSKCSFFHQMEIRDFFNKNLQQILELGEANNICPYYASRNIIQSTDILCLPYASIIKKDIRNKLGINIHNSIIVFDEGHNLLENEKQINSSQVKIEQMEIIAQQIDQYLKRYQQKLKIKNYRLLTHLLQILRGFTGVACLLLSEHKKSGEENKKYVKLNFIEFLLKLGLKQMKIQLIMKYFSLNNMDKKLVYFNNADVQDNKQKKAAASRISVASINQTLSFLLGFTKFNQCSEILMFKWGESKKGNFKILCFESAQLQQIVKKSKMTIIAGGTMQPMDQLLARTNRWKDKMIIKKCSHIIRQDQCKIYIISRYSNKQIVFNHASFSHSLAVQTLKPICIALLAKVIEKTEKGGGIVVFIQNYQLITFFKNIFKDQPYREQIIYDCKESGAEVKDQDIFGKFKALIESDCSKNYILLSVMGGKLSEGINFSDRLARSIIVFGLPYSNIYSPEITQTMAFIDNKHTANFTGKKYYENLCIKTLNQTIGRGIRHINDYANIYLVDCRFQDIKYKLSSWMSSRIQVINQLSIL